MIGGTDETLSRRRILIGLESRRNRSSTVAKTPHI
jgi:hypothetical protein